MQSVVFVLRQNSSHFLLNFENLLYIETRHPQQDFAIKVLLQTLNYQNANLVPVLRQHSEHLLMIMDPHTGIGKADQLLLQ